MQGLSASNLVLAWELGKEQHPVDRALLLLTLASPETPSPELSALTIGQRNARLLTLRQQTLGTSCQCGARCPNCHESLEFSLDLEAIRQPEPRQFTGQVTVENFSVRFRLPRAFQF